METYDNLVELLTFHILPIINIHFSCFIHHNFIPETSNSLTFNKFHSPVNIWNFAYKAEHAIIELLLLSSTTYFCQNV